MATTLDQLGTRTLQKLGVLAANEAPAAADLEKAVEKVKAAQYALDAEGLLRWSSADIPHYAEEPLVMMAAFMASGDFERPFDAGLYQAGQTMIQRAVNLGQVGPIRTDYF